jgi:hypothetical protein
MELIRACLPSGMEPQTDRSWHHDRTVCGAAFGAVLGSRRPNAGKHVRVYASIGTVRYPKHMRHHEFLYFLDALTAGMGRAPTREDLSMAYFKHAKLFTGNGSSMRTNLRQMRLKKAVREFQCCETCHAKHIGLTAHGRALLDYWNENGCGSENETEQACIRADALTEYGRKLAS